MKRGTFQALTLLRSQPWITTHDLLEGGCGSRYGARLGELREWYACRVISERVRQGSWRYRLESEPVGLTVKAERSDAWKEAERLVRWRTDHAEADTHMTAVFGSTERPGHTKLVTAHAVARGRSVVGNEGSSVEAARVSPGRLKSDNSKTVPAGMVAVRPHLRRIRPELPAEQLTLLEATA